MAPDPLAKPRFVERQTYRRRRMVDAACLLPVLGLLLWCLPLAWSDSDGTISTSRALVYIFVVWGGLSGAAVLLIRVIRGLSSPDRPGGRP